MATCFVLIPFSEPFSQFYDKIISPTVTHCGLSPVRGDSSSRSGIVMESVWQMIRESDLVVAELTERNSNVLYELGLAHAAGKPVILIAENITEVPFDLRPFRVITYSKEPERWDETLRNELTDSIQATLADPTRAVASYFRSDIAPSESAWSVSDHDNPNFRKRVGLLYLQLKEQNYSPDLIVGVARGGLVVAFHLSKFIPNAPLVPVISLWPNSGFDNAFNPIAFEPGDLPSSNGRPHILIVDDIVRSGRTLRDAKAYLEGQVDPAAWQIKTAAVSFQGRLYPRAVPPDFYVDEPVDEIKDQAGEVEPLISFP